jgi:nucleotide-binding universal stress UspA family protein
MNLVLLVLADLSAAAARAAQYAAVLAAPLRARLELLHCYHDPPLELATVMLPQLDRLPADTTAGLHALARPLPVPAEVVVSTEPLAEAVAQAIAQHHPPLLALGLSAEPTLLDRLLRNRALPMLRATHLPLLLVPEAAPTPCLPRRVLIAVDGEPFVLNAAARALAPLLATWPAVYSVLHLAATRSPRLALVDVELSGLLPRSAPLELYEVAARQGEDPALRADLAPLELYGAPTNPAAGVLRAVAASQADLLVLIARPRSFLGRLFHHSVTAAVLRACPVPVLLLPAEAPELPDWMPAMS